MSNSEFQLSSSESSGRKEEDFGGRKDFEKRKERAAMGREEDQRDQKPPGCVTRDEAFGIELTIATGGNSAMEGIDGTTLFALSALFGTDIADGNNKNVFVDDDEKDEKDDAKEETQTNNCAVARIDQHRIRDDKSRRHRFVSEHRFSVRRGERSGRERLLLHPRRRARRTGVANQKSVQETGVEVSPR